MKMRGFREDKHGFSRRFDLMFGIASTMIIVVWILVITVIGGAIWLAMTADWHEVARDAGGLVRSFQDGRSP